MDQGGEERDQVDEAFLPHVQGQPGPLAALRVGLQPGQFPASVGVAETGTTLVADDAERKADQDRSQGDAALEVRDLPTSRGGRDAELIRSDSRPHRAVGNPAADGRVT